MAADRLGNRPRPQVDRQALCRVISVVPRRRRRRKQKMTKLWKTSGRNELRTMSFARTMSVFYLRLLRGVLLNPLAFFLLLALFLSWIFVDHLVIFGSGILRYEGHFELITLSGLYTFTETGCKLGSIRVLLANLDANIFGGVVVGSLIAAMPVQVTHQVVIQALFVACKSGIFHLANKEVNNVIEERYPVSQMLYQ